MVYGEELMLAGRFDTFEDDQKFAITRYGIKLFFDYETPAVYTGFYSEIMIVPYSEQMVLLESFFDEEVSIYNAKGPAEKNLLDPGVKIDEKLEVSEDYDGISMHRSATYSTEIPEALENRINELYQEGDSEEIKAIEEIRPYYQEALSQYGKENAYGESRHMITYDVSGDFATIRIYRYDYVGGSDGSSYKDFYSQQSMKYEVYDLKAEKLKPMELQDIFVDGADIEALIKSAMIDSINASLSNESDNSNMTGGTYVFGQGENKEKDAQYINGLYNAINGFTPQSNSIILLFDKTPEDIYKEVYDVEIVPENNTSYIYSVDILPYAHIDPRTMTIFR
ncbi:MAG: hypothetical protein PHX63_01990 [Eubacteriales bacterium]|nr:hypothetical protein [Eubacteriales bacterium]